MANLLRRDRQIQVLTGLYEGLSVRSVERMTGVHWDTILRLMVRAGQGCDRVLDDLMRDLPCQRLQIDELWGYIGKKERHLKPDDDRSRLGDIWTFVALDADSKIVPCYRVGRRDKPTATAFLTDLSSRLKNRIQLSADALDAYVDASIEAFGLEEVDFGQIVKSYEAEPIGPGRYSPPHVTAVHRNRVSGNPDPKHISTSYVERQNLSLRMGIRRLTRLTNAFSRKLENFEAHMGLWFGYYNLVRIHLTLRCTPAMEAGVLPSVWTMGDLLDAALGN